MKNLKVVEVNDDEIKFENEIKLFSDHRQDCCENHFLDFADLTMDDFEGLEFDLSSDNFFRRVEDYGIELFPTNGHPVRVPGYGFNNGYYGSNIDLVITDNGRDHKRYDVSECQTIHDG